MNFWDSDFLVNYSSNANLMTAFFTTLSSLIVLKIARKGSRLFFAFTLPSSLGGSHTAWISLPSPHLLFQTPILNRFRDMVWGYRFASVQGRDSAGDFIYAVVGAGGEAHGFHGTFQKLGLEAKELEKIRKQMRLHHRMGVSWYPTNGHNFKRIIDFIKIHQVGPIPKQKIREICFAPNPVYPKRYTPLAAESGRPDERNPWPVSNMLKSLA